MRTFRRKIDHARPGFHFGRTWPHCCDSRIPGQACLLCGAGPDDQPISVNRALASNA